MSTFSEPSLKNLTDINYGRLGNEQHKPLQELIRPHIESFNHFLHQGLSDVVKDLEPVSLSLPNGQIVEIFIQDAVINSPHVVEGCQHASTLKVYPRECRERGIVYDGALEVEVAWRIDGKLNGPLRRKAGMIPLMVKSDACHLSGLTPKQLVARGEEAEEFGGYFIVNGIEKIIRMLIMPRRNYPIALVRPSFTNRGPMYTEYAVTMRCVKKDLTAGNMTLHYLSNGTATLCFHQMKEMYFIPVILILKGLVDVQDCYIYNELIRGKEDNSFYKGCIAAMLRQAQAENLSTQASILDYIGDRFRVRLKRPPWHTNNEVGEYILRQCVCIHLKSNEEKVKLLIYMIRKLFALAKGECVPESSDNPMFQEVLLPGHLYQMFLKEKLGSWLSGIQVYIEHQAKTKGLDFILDPVVVSNGCNRTTQLTKPMSYLLATGNLISSTGLGLMQASGMAVVADKLNFYRYLSHFRCVHRGAFFATMRTTTVRRLLPESWGFMCPVHTPDGAPCGLLNHLSGVCQVINFELSTKHIPSLLQELGMSAYEDPTLVCIEQCYPVMLNGQLLGYLSDDMAQNVADQLRIMKVKRLRKISPVMEVCLVLKTAVASQYPGLYLFTETARMMRPVINLSLNTVEMIGTFEQVYLNICVTPKEAHTGITTHQEISETSMLSAIASLTPFSDLNQSPRNMYQCQMGKQTMGTPLHALASRADNKLYKLQTPQSPLVRPHAHDHYKVDEYPLGTNAVVAVISYTGYDMEDAMILNKGAFERGFGHGSVYKCEQVNLRNIARDNRRIVYRFATKPGDPRTENKLEPDGLPSLGTRLNDGDPFYSYINIQTGDVKVQIYRGQEEAVVEQIKLCGNDRGDEELQKICIMLRIERNPIIGDKFSSRHGQKGICSQKWPVENMPFSESGITPDILFNPHGFPSRMTIGMMVESMAGKSAASHGLCHDATPFTFSEDDPAIDYFGRLLRAAGYNYYGNERMYSGIDGCELEVDIFVGVVYYQRLRHMVSDKFQVRTTGPIDQLTHQPVKGRKRAGGVRFGEMERDALIAHGTSFLLHDRLFSCSDACLTHVCTKCGSLLSPSLGKPASTLAAASFEAGREWRCTVCPEGENTLVQPVNIPYVFRYLVAELAAMNIKITLDVKEE